MIIRRINNIKKNTATTPLPRYSAFVLESNRIRRLNRDALAGLDLDTEAAPFVDHKNGTADTQHGVLLGAKYKLSEWREELTDTATTDFHVPLTITDSANLLFADFQHHGMNVFGVHDDMTYYSTDNTLCTLDAAEVSYQVIGYHALRGYDPIANSDAGTNKDLLSTHGMLLKQDDSEWLAGSRPVRSLCHGQVDLRWSRQTRPAMVPADDAAEAFTMSQPVAIGTDLIDAIAAIFDAPAKKEHADPVVAAAFRHLQVLAANPADGEDENSKSQQSKTTAFKPVHGGHFWKVRSEGKQSQKSPPATTSEAVPPQPSAVQATTSPQESTEDSTETAAAARKAEAAAQASLLHSLNASQRLLDAAHRHSRFLQHLLFCEWWKARAAGFTEACASDVSTDDADDDGFESMQSWYQENLPATRDRVRQIVTELLTLHLREKQTQPGLVKALQDRILLLQQGKSVEKVASDRFFSAKDPTILLSDMESSWPDEFDADTIPVQLNTQVTRQTDTTGQDDAWQLFQNEFTSLPSWVQACVDDLRHGWTVPESSDSPQAWFPLFIEWEADYFHVPYEHWTLEETPAGTIQYRIKETVDLAGQAEIPRGLSGRSNILPEGARALNTLVEQVASRSSPEMLTNILPSKQREAIDKAIVELSNVLGAELHGITNHLVTLVQGTHALPNATPAKEATSRWLSTLFPRLSVRDHSAVLQFLAAGSGADNTPYTALLPVQGVSRDTTKLFRPVTHGQVRFTKLNIVDKFGQVICAFDPRPGQLFRPIYPSVSSDLACQRNETLPGRVFANSVLAEPEGRCQFFQLGPRINQDARFNAVWVTRTDQNEKTSWRPLLETESPIWGWVVCNFQDESLQVLSGEGELCGEILISSSLWLSPEGDMANTAPDTTNKDLVAFMTRLASSNEFLRQVWDMVVDANDHIHHAPGEADSQPALIGRPLALVSMGWSLELATRPMCDQTDSPEQSEDLLKYHFDLKLGDRHSLHDGLVGYTPVSGDTFTFDQFYTLYGDNSSSSSGSDSHSGPVLPARNISFNPYWISPTEYSSTTADAFVAAHTEKLQVYAALVDPFQDINGFSGILPTTTLSVPPWVLEQSVRAMKTILRAGPLLIEGDIPAVTAPATAPVPTTAPAPATAAAAAAAASSSSSTTPSNTQAATTDTATATTAAPRAALPIDTPPGSWTWIQPVIDAGNSTNRVFALTPAPKDFAVVDGLQTVVEGFMRSTQQG